MRAAFILAALCLVGPAVAQESVGSFNVQTVNGVRIWRPKPATVSERSEPQSSRPVTIVVNSAPASAPDYDDGWGDDGWWGASIGGPFFSRPFFRSRPFFYGRLTPSRLFFPGGGAGHHGRAMSVQHFRGRF